MLDDTLEIVRDKKLPLIYIGGEIFCLGSLKMTVRKTLFVSIIRRVEYVKTIDYAYNLSLEGIGNIFRYDNEHVHEGHCFPHHKHVYDPPGKNHRVLEIESEEDWPTLGEALREARQYYWNNLSTSGN